MKATTGVLLVHGMGSHEKSYADKFVKKLQAYLDQNEVPDGSIAFEAAFWHKPLQAIQDHRLQGFKQSSLRWNDLRRFVVSCFGDVVSYQGTPNRPNPVYGQIHSIIHSHITSLRSRLLDDDSPLIIIASSLGSVIMSNYIWDRRKLAAMRTEDLLGNSRFEQLNSLCGFVTLGSPLPLFTLQIEKAEDIKSITMSDSRLDATIPHRWLNFYDPDDVFGFPLQPISPSYRSAVSEDIKVNVGGLFSSWTPLSHLGYLGRGNRSVVRKVGSYVKEVAEAVSIAESRMSVAG